MRLNPYLHATPHTSMARGGIALIDEPELHLNPAVCRNIIPFLCEKIAKEPGVQLFICTRGFPRRYCAGRHFRAIRLHSAPFAITSLIDASRQSMTKDTHEISEAFRRLW